MPRARPQEEVYRLVEEAGHEIDLIKEIIAVSRALDRPKGSGLPPRLQEQKRPAPHRETLAGRLAFVDAS